MRITPFFPCMYGPEASAAGHNRCIVPVKPEHVDAWLNTDGTNLAALDAILDDRNQPYYEHRLAASQQSVPISCRRIARVPCCAT